MELENDNTPKQLTHFLNLNQPQVLKAPSPDSFKLEAHGCSQTQTFAATFRPLTIKSKLKDFIKSFQEAEYNITAEVDKTMTNLDKDADGFISKDELKNGLDGVQQVYTEKDLQLILD